MMKKQNEETNQKTDQIQKEPKTTENNCVTQEQIDELTNTLKRIQAEFENYKKRVDKENQQLIKNSNANLIMQLLPVLDSFELAIKNSNGSTESIALKNSDNNSNNIQNIQYTVEHLVLEKFRKGMELIYAQLFSILEDKGLRIIETKNKKFDPYKHEVLLVQESDKEEDMILREFQKGYMLNDIILRHSKVMISKHQNNKDNNQNTQENVQEVKHD